MALKTRNSGIQIRVMTIDGELRTASGPELPVNKIAVEMPYGYGSRHNQRLLNEQSVLSASSLVCFALQRPVSSGNEHSWHLLSAPCAKMATFVSIRSKRSSSDCSAKLSGPRPGPAASFDASSEFIDGSCRIGSPRAFGKTSGAAPSFAASMRTPPH